MSKKLTFVFIVVSAATIVAADATQRTTSKIVRLEIAKSGDLANEFSDRTVSVEMKDGRKESFPSSILRVWKKKAGQWKVAAHFSRAHER